MRETNPPSSSPGGNKIVLLLLAGGTIILAVALFILFKKRSSPPPTPPEPPKIEEPAEPAAPLVIAQPTRPLLKPDEPDGGDDETGSAKTKKRRRKASDKIGSIDAKEVSSFMNARFGQVKACYERRLKINSLLEGKLDLNIDISPVGKVTAVTVNRDTVGDSQMLDCVKRAIRSWNFPKPKGGRVIIGKTFNFKKKEK